MKKLIKIAGLMAVGAAFALQGAKAQELYLGFETDGFNSNETGAASNLILDLGTVSSLMTATQPVILSSKFSLADLNTVFGNGPTDVLFGALGVSTATPKTVFVSIPDGSSAPVITKSNLVSLDSTVSGFPAEYNNGTTEGDNSAVKLTDNTTFQGFAGQDGTYNEKLPDTLANYSANGAETLDLYSISNVGTTNATVSEFGTLTLTVTGNSTDSLVFNPSATPEPSTYLMMGLGLATLGFVMRRRLALNA